MEAQTVNLRGYIHRAVNLVQTRKIYLFTKLPASFSSEIRSSTGVSMKRKKNQCRNSVEEADCRGVSDIEEDKLKTIIRRKKLAVFVSGGGSNFRSIYEATLDCGGAEYAREKGIPVLVFPKRIENQYVFSAEDLVIAFRSYKVDFVLLAGYLKLIPAELIQAYPKAILNIHPSLLPAFGGKGYYGMKVHKAVITSGARYSGPSIHYVDEHYDTGCILAQRVVPVLAKDTAEDLAARVLHESNEKSEKWWEMKDKKNGGGEKKKKIETEIWSVNLSILDAEQRQDAKYIRPPIQHDLGEGEITLVKDDQNDRVQREANPNFHCVDIDRNTPI
ncbi:hypothetical protein ACS0TY_003448 [Phlomoides rotata]